MAEAPAGRGRPQQGEEPGEPSTTARPTDSRDSQLRATRLRWAGLTAVACATTAGVLAYLLSPGYGIAPEPGLRQLDLLYLDEPAAGLDQLGIGAGRPAVVVFCEACGTPQVEDAQVVRSGDPVLAGRYALTTADGSVGPGYALVDADGNLRYRTFDPAPGDHGAEIQVLVDALDESS